MSTSLVQRVDIGRSGTTSLTTTERNSSTHLLKHLDLRFRDCDQESSYKDSLEVDVLRSGLLVVLCCAAAIPVALVPVISRESQREDKPLGESFDVRLMVMLSWAFNFAVMSVYIILNLLNLCKGWFAWMNWEALFVSVVTLYATSLSFANFWHMPQLAGQDPTEVWFHDARGSDVFILLAMDGLMTMVTMYVPIRACVLWIPIFFAVGTYFTNTIAMQSIFPREVPMIIGAILGLGIMAYHGAFRREATHREMWLLGQMVIEAEDVIKEQESTIEETAGQIKGLRTVADALCDIIIKLTSDLRVHGADITQDSFFETSAEGRQIVDFLDDRDRGRFNALVGTSKVGVPACMPATIRKGSVTSEVHLLLVDIGRREPRFLVGIRVETEHLQPAKSDTSKDLDSGDIVPGLVGILPSIEVSPHDAPDVNEDDSDFSFRTYPKNAPPPVPLFTPTKARALCIKKLLPRWNIARNIDSCCQFHTVVDSVEDAVHHLKKMPCEPLWRTWSGGQCARCKCMRGKEQTRCVVCGYTEDGEANDDKEGRVAPAVIGSREL